MSAQGGWPLPCRALQGGGSPQSTVQKMQTEVCTDAPVDSTTLCDIRTARPFLPGAAQKFWGFPKRFALAFLHPQVLTDLTSPCQALIPQG